MYLIMADEVEEFQVVKPVILAIAVFVMDFCLIVHGEEELAVHPPFPSRFPCPHATSELWLSSTFLEQVQFPGFADLLPLMMDPFTPPAWLPPLGEAGDEGGTHLVLRALSVDTRLAIQGNDILMDEGACTLPVQGQGEAFAIRGFQGDMRLKLGLVLFGDVEDPPELVSEPVSFEVTV
jgi:hypothetical protein